MQLGELVHNCPSQDKLRQLLSGELKSDDSQSLEFLVSTCNSSDCESSLFSSPDRSCRSLSCEGQLCTSSPSCIFFFRARSLSSLIALRTARPRYQNRS